MKEEEGSSSCFKQLFSGKPDPQHWLLGGLRAWETIIAEDVRTWCRGGGCDCSLSHAVGENAGAHCWEGDPVRGARCPPLPPRGTSTVWGACIATPPACLSSALLPPLSCELVHGAVRALEPLSDSPSTAGAGAHHVPGLSSLPDLPSPSGLIIG